jgi:hypothetical protein
MEKMNGVELTIRKVKDRWWPVWQTVLADQIMDNLPQVKRAPKN